MMQSCDHYERCIDTVLNTMTLLYGVYRFDHAYYQTTQQPWNYSIQTDFIQFYSIPHLLFILGK